MGKYKLTKKEYEAVISLESYYLSLDFIVNDEYGHYCKEAKEASVEEQAILNGLGKLLKLHRKLYPLN